MPKYSIIIPVYNCIEYLTSCVESILAVNSYNKKWIHEIILVDDGSADGSTELCDLLSNEYSGIYVIHQQNRGVSAARNAGLKAANGEYIIFVDSDDTIDPEKLAKLLEAVDECDAPDMAVFGMCFDYYHRDKLYRSDTCLPPVEGMKSYDECNRGLYELYEYNCLSALWNKVIKKSVIDAGKILLREDMFLYEDLEFSLRILENCSSVFFFREAVYHYRQAEDEGNIGRRLLRISHIPDLIEKIETALNAFDTDNEKILLSLYMTLARGKISDAPEEEIGVICGDFKAWIDERELAPSIVGKEYAMYIYNGDVSKLISMRRRTKIRHAVANWIKRNIGDFRKW